jgi:hypothetical protein
MIPFGDGKEAATAFRYNDARRQPMQFPIFIEPVANNGYRASSGSPLALSADGATRDEALRNLQQQLRQRMQAGGEVATVEIPAHPIENPWVRYAGMFKDDPDFQDVVDIMAENRRQMDADPEIP